MSDLPALGEEAHHLSRGDDLGVPGGGKGRCHCHSQMSSERGSQRLRREAGGEEAEEHHLAPGCGRESSSVVDR